MNKKEGFFDLNLPDHVIKKMNREAKLGELFKSYSRGQLTEEEVRKKLDYMGVTPKEADNAVELFNMMRAFSQPHVSSSHLLF
tara:strand:+ start:422 stop:670 length:249 start_codon:yes stop_codon:yes gene_type:complete